MQDLNYNIIGANSPLLEVTLSPDETLIAEAGAMLYTEENIQFEAKLGDGSEQSGFFDELLSASKRLFTGESLFLTHFTNTDSKPRKMAFGSPYPGTILPISLAELPEQTAIFQREVFLCATYGTKISIEVTPKIGAGVLGGEGFILQKLEGEGTAFIHAGGSVIEKKLEDEELLVDTGAIVGFSPSISYDIERVTDLRSSIFGGEGLFLAKLQGTGKVWLQSMPFRSFVGKIAQKMSEG